MNGYVEELEILKGLIGWYWDMYNDPDSQAGTRILEEEERKVAYTWIEIALTTDQLPTYLRCLYQVMPTLPRTLIELDDETLEEVLQHGFWNLSSRDLLAFALSPKALAELQVHIWVRPSEYWLTTMKTERYLRDYSKESDSRN